MVPLGWRPLPSRTSLNAFSNFTRTNFCTPCQLPERKFRLSFSLSRWMRCRWMRCANGQLVSEAYQSALTSCLFLRCSLIIHLLLSLTPFKSETAYSPPPPFALANTHRSSTTVPVSNLILSTSNSARARTDCTGSAVHTFILSAYILGSRLIKLYGYFAFEHIACRHTPLHVFRHFTTTTSFDLMTA